MMWDCGHVRRMLADLKNGHGQTNFTAITYPACWCETDWSLRQHSSLPKNPDPVCVDVVGKLYTLGQQRLFNLFRCTRDDANKSKTWGNSHPFPRPSPAPRKLGVKDTNNSIPFPTIFENKPLVAISIQAMLTTPNSLLAVDKIHDTYLCGHSQQPANNQP